MNQEKEHTKALLTLFYFTLIKIGADKKCGKEKNLLWKKMV